MQAVILAAGQGVRLRPITDDRPKPMVPIGEMPILEYTFSILPKVIDEVILVVGYKQEKIREHFGEEWKGRKIIYVDQPEPKGSADALERVRTYIKGPHFLLMYGDDLYHAGDLEACVKGTEQVMLVKEAEHPERMGVCQLDDEGYVTDFVEKPKIPPSNLASIGVFVLHEDIFSVAPAYLPNGENCLAAQIPDLIKLRPLKTVRAQFWHPIGYPEDVEKAKELLPGLLAERQKKLEAPITAPH
ncbi:MAG: nucleotidyltransferase family protein [Patescibacteria group bacterium]